MNAWKPSRAVETIKFFTEACHVTSLIWACCPSCRKRSWAGTSSITSFLFSSCFCLFFFFLLFELELELCSSVPSSLLSFSSILSSAIVSFSTKATKNQIFLSRFPDFFLQTKLSSMFQNHWSNGNDQSLSRSCLRYNHICRALWVECETYKKCPESTGYFYFFIRANPILRF